MTDPTVEHRRRIIDIFDGSLVRDTSGNSTVEYSLLILMVVGCAMVATTVVGARSSAVFTSLSGDAPVATRVGHGTATPVAASDEGVSTARERLVRLYDQVSPYRLPMTELIAVVALGALWYGKRRTRLRKQVVGGDEEVPDEIVGDAKENGLIAKRQQIYRFLTWEMESLLTDEMTVKRVMSRKPVMVPPNCAKGEVNESMKSANSRHLLVCEDGRLVGIISDRDAMAAEGATAGELMTPHPLTVTEDTLINVAVTQMIHHHISCLAVVDNDGRPTGVLTTTDLVMTLQCVLQILHNLGSTLLADAATNPTNDDDPAVVEAHDDGSPSDEQFFDDAEMAAVGAGSLSD